MIRTPTAIRTMLAAALTAATVAALTANAAATPARTAAAPCAASQLNAAFTLIFGSNGAGNVGYQLTIANHGAACTLAAPLPARLLNRHGAQLPTHMATTPSGSYTVTIPSGSFALATARFSPDVSGPGESGRQCEPTAYTLRLTVAGSSLGAPMDPTPVCEHGSISISRLTVPKGAPKACATGSLKATFSLTGKQTTNVADRSLKLTNTGAAACWVESFPALRLLGGNGAALPTHVVGGVPAPQELRAHKSMSLLATIPTKGSRCSGPASTLAITPVPGARPVDATLQPPVTACNGGTIELEPSA